LQKYSDFPKTQISCIFPAIPFHTGALRNVTNAERGAVAADGAMDERA
jgi:hypothetical protein